MIFAETRLRFCFDGIQQFYKEMIHSLIGFTNSRCSSLPRKSFVPRVRSPRSFINRCRKMIPNNGDPTLPAPERFSVGNPGWTWRTDSEQRLPTSVNESESRQIYPDSSLATARGPASIARVAREYQMQPSVGPGPLRINYRDELNPQQFAAVSAPDGPTLVLAGAGAGKTRTLTYRVAWLLEHGIPADRILLLTFTNKSAREMMQRVADLLPGELGPLWGGTFHSIGLRILRLHADRLGYQPGFTVADREDSKDLLTTCIADAGIDVKATRFPKAEVLGDWFSMALNTGRQLYPRQTAVLAKTKLLADLPVAYQYLSGVSKSASEIFSGIDISAMSTGTSWVPRPTCLASSRS